MQGIFLKNNMIDKEKWNKSLSKSLNPCTYAYSWYLDTVCNNWDAIVSENYSIIMPLPNYGKFNLTVYQPVLSPKLGIFYSDAINKSDINIFLQSLPTNIKNLNLNLNRFNSLQDKTNTSRKDSYSIDLYANYNTIYENYSNYIRKILEEDKNKKKYIISGISPNEIIAFLNKTNFFSNNKNYDTLRRVLSLTTLRRLSTISAVFSEKNELQGVGVFILSSQSADLLIVSAEENNEKTIALIIDKFIKTNAGKGITLNLECDQTKTAENIFIEFGAQKLYYEQLSIKRLPKFLQLFKKKE
ncbi:MAG: hypothetical protein JXL97_10935 [Bacteroidales bacterium]|nr:hypothetical protein [Bacteroidales bacterium]